MAQEHAAQNNGWTEISSASFVKWDSPQVIEGEYMGFTETVGQFGPERRHVVKTSNGVREFFAPSMLARLLEHVKNGDYVRAEFTGETVMSRRGKPVKVFRVAIRTAA